MIQTEKFTQSIKRIIAYISNDSFEYSENIQNDYRMLKSKYSLKEIVEKLNVNEAEFAEFERALSAYLKYINDPDLKNISMLRLANILSVLSKKSSRNFNVDIENVQTAEITAIKQIRALELVMRDMIYSHTGGAEEFVRRINEIIKADVVDKWLDNADESGLLSGSTFSELSTVFLDNRFFNLYEHIFIQDKALRYAKNKRKSLRFFLDDIRLIRNSIAHNRSISNVETELLNEYYIEISRLIEEGHVKGLTDIQPDAYFNISDEEADRYIKKIKEDLSEIKEDILDLSNKIEEGFNSVKNDTELIKTNTLGAKKYLKYSLVGSVIITAILILILILNKNSSDRTEQILHNTENINTDIKEVKEIVSGDSELKNLSTTNDLAVTKELNERTKNTKARRVAIVYFDNTSGEKKLDRLKKGLAGMLISDLSNIEMLDIVERDRLQDLIKEQKLNSSKGFDQSTMSKIGKLLGAEIIVAGSYFEMFGSFRIDSRFINVETGEILKSEGVDGQTANFFKLEKQLVWKIIKNLDVKLQPEEKQRLKFIDNKQVIQLQEAIQFADALDAIDNGDFNTAKAKLENVLNGNSQFVAAQEELLKLNRTK